MRGRPAGIGGSDVEEESMFGVNFPFLKIQRDMKLIENFTFKFLQILRCLKVVWDRPETVERSLGV